MSFGLFAIRFHREFTITLTHPSAQLSFSKLFISSIISPCHAFPDVTVSSWHYYILPSLLQISVYCSNTKYTPNVHPFSERRSLFRDRDAVM